MRRQRRRLATSITGTLAVVATTAAVLVACASATPSHETHTPGPTAVPAPTNTSSPPLTAGSTPAPVTPAPAPTSNITLTGAVDGQLTGIRSSCRLHDRVNNGHNFDSPFVQAVGLLNGHGVQVSVFDPASFGSWEQAAHVIVTQYASRSTISTGSDSSWIVQSPAGISLFNVSRGARIDVTVQPNWQDSSTTPTRPLTVNGTIVC